MDEKQVLLEAQKIVGLWAVRRHIHLLQTSPSMMRGLPWPLLQDQPPEENELAIWFCDLVAAFALMRKRHHWHKDCEQGVQRLLAYAMPAQQMTPDALAALAEDIILHVGYSLWNTAREIEAGDGEPMVAVVMRHMVDTYNSVLNPTTALWDAEHGNHSGVVVVDNASSESAIWLV